MISNANKLNSNKKQLYLDEDQNIRELKRQRKKSDANKNEMKSEDNRYDQKAIKKKIDKILKNKIIENSEQKIALNTNDSKYVLDPLFQKPLFNQFDNDGTNNLMMNQDLQNPFGDTKHLGLNVNNIISNNNDNNKDDSPPIAASLLDIMIYAHIGRARVCEHQIVDIWTGMMERTKLSKKLIDQLTPWKKLLKVFSQYRQDNPSSESDSLTVGTLVNENYVTEEELWNSGLINSEVVTTSDLGRQALDQLEGMHLDDVKLIPANLETQIQGLTATNEKEQIKIQAEYNKYNVSLTQLSGLLQGFNRTAGKIAESMS